MKLSRSFACLTAALVTVVLAGVLTLSSRAGSAAPGAGPFASFDPQVNELLAKMTLDEKIGQMTQADQRFLKPASDIGKYFLGSLLNGGDSDPAMGNSVEAWAHMYGVYQSYALETRLAIPLLYGVDAVHGHNNVQGAVVFPHNIGLGCTRNPALVERVARITAEEVLATGINWTFAPSVAVPRDPRWGRTYEGFGEDPGLVREMGEAAVRGYQGSSLASPLSILACAKHYAGDGGTVYGTGKQKRSSGGIAPLDQGDTRLDEKTLRELHMQGYVAAIRAGVGSIMPSYSSWNGVKCSANKHLLTDILKNELGFEGFLVSDYGAIDELPGTYKEKIAATINAGMDMVMVPRTYAEFFNGLKELVQEGQVPTARIDDAVRRILRVKFAMGLMERRRDLTTPDAKLVKNFGSAAHRAVARDAVRQSVVLLKNERRALPIPKSLARIHVGGRNSNNLGNQCGGWTISWQGMSYDITPGGTTILEAIRNAAPKTNVTYSRDGTRAQGANLGVVVIGETPYAEAEGDSADLKLASEDIAAVNNMKAAGIPLVVILISGRPMILGDVLDKADALLAAWLPGTEGDGVADVLFGKYKPTGKLSRTWPRSISQLPINVGDQNYDPLFAYGYGLSY